MTVTILAVDDSRTMRDMIRMSLAPAGFEVHLAEDGVHGVEVLRDIAPDAIITDINMPRMDGFGFIDPDTFKIGFANDTSDADAAFLRDSQVPINMSAFGSKLEHAAWRTKPSWAVIATDDRAFDQRMLHAMAERIGAKVTKVAASHAVFMTQPKVVAEVIEEAAQQASTTAR